MTEDELLARLDKGFGGLVGVEAAAHIRDQSAEIEQLRIEIYGLPVPKDGVAISIFDLPPDKRPDA